MDRLTTATIVLLALLSLPVFAQDTVRVDSMNYPAWVVRDYETQPLFPGFPLQADDLLRTGKGGRLLLRLADGSVVKIGESARFVLDSAQVSQDQAGSFTEFAFQVLRGAFRFSSSSSRSAFIGHRVNFKVGVIAASLRGTDIWGRSSSEHDLACLIEGEVSVSDGRELPLSMKQALSFYIKPKGAPPLPVEQADMQQLQKWVGETELEASAGIAAEDGGWQLVLISLTSRKQADRKLKSYREQGFAARRKSVIRDGRTLHRLLLPDFISVDAALNARSRVEALLGVTDAWVWKAN